MDIEDSEKAFEMVKNCYYKSVKESVQFPFIFEEAWKRTNSALAIQRMWRGYQSRKKINAPENLLKKKAATRIQRWIRNLAFFNKIGFHIDSYFYIKHENTNSIVMKKNELLDFKNIYLQK